MHSQHQIRWVGAFPSGARHLLFRGISCSQLSKQTCCSLINVGDSDSTTGSCGWLRACVTWSLNSRIYTSIPYSKWWISPPWLHDHQLLHISVSLMFGVMSKLLACWNPFSDAASHISDDLPSQSWLVPPHGVRSKISFGSAEKWSSVTHPNGATVFCFPMVFNPPPSSHHVNV